jgi:signal peptidase II
VSTVPAADPGADAAPVRRRIGPLQRWLAVGIPLAIVLIVDQWSKSWALNDLGLDRVVPVVSTLQFRLEFNTGMAFSAFRGGGAIIAAVAVVITVVLLVVARKLTSVFQLVLIGIVIGGALGNVIDRATRVGEISSRGGEIAQGFMSGAVVDFIDLQWWPVFNLADAAIVVGGIALALTGLRIEDDPADDEQAADDGATGVAGPVAPDA